MTDDMDSDRLRTRHAAQLEKVGADTGDERYRRAAAMLRGKPAGRPAVNDTVALAYAESLLDAGLVRSKNKACIEAAKIYAPTELAFDAMRARLLTKFEGN